MAKPPPIDTHVPEGAIRLGPSRTQKREERRRTQNGLDELTELLAAMPPKLLTGLGLDPDVHEALLAYKRLAHGSASARQRRLVARLLRNHEPVALMQRARRALGGVSPDPARTVRLEAWRARLLDEGDAGLAALLQTYPDADRQPLRQAIRAAISERTEAKSTRRAKALYQLLASLPDPPPPDAPPDGP